MNLNRIRAFKINFKSIYTLKFANFHSIKEFKFLSGVNINLFHSRNFYKNIGKTFTTNESDDTHSDFKPKIKEINDDNVMKVIDDWVNQNDVLIFMKGTREMPRCGFSNYVVQILNFYKIRNIKVVNILENPLVRETVKKYSNWPTYPQLYVKGNLIGGCDIIKEMHENGTFKELVEREKLQSNE